MNVGAVVFSSLQALVTGRVYPIEFPQSPTAPIWPAIRYTVISSTPDADICGDAGSDDTDQIRVQLDVVATTYAAMRILSVQVMAAMSSMATPAVRELLAESRDFETSTWRCQIDYLIQPSSPA